MHSITEKRVVAAISGKKAKPKKEKKRYVNDDDFSYVAAWEYTSSDELMHKEELHFM